MQNIFVFALEWPALQASLEANSKVGLVASLGGTWAGKGGEYGERGWCQCSGVVFGETLGRWGVGGEGGGLGGGEMGGAQCLGWCLVQLGVKVGCLVEGW